MFLCSSSTFQHDFLLHHSWLLVCAWIFCLISLSLAFLPQQQEKVQKTFLWCKIKALVKLSMKRKNFYALYGIFARLFLSHLFVQHWSFKCRENLCDFNRKKLAAKLCSTYIHVLHIPLPQIFVFSTKATRLRCRFSKVVKLFMSVKHTPLRNVLSMSSMETPNMAILFIALKRKAEISLLRVVSCENDCH